MIKFPVAFLDALLAQDPSSRVAAEVVVNTGLVLITGEVPRKAQVELRQSRNKIAKLTTDAVNGFCANNSAQSCWL